MVVTPEEFEDWLQSNVTQAFKKALKNKREWMKENLILGNIENGDWVKGKASVISEILEMTYESLQEDLSDK